MQNFLDHSARVKIIHLSKMPISPKWMWSKHEGVLEEGPTGVDLSRIAYMLR